MYASFPFPFVKTNLYANELSLCQTCKLDKEMPSIYDKKLQEIDLIFQTILTIET